MKFDIVASLKEFFFDIIGFFIPGFILILIIEEGFNIKTGFLSEVYIMIIISYALGYVTHSFTLLKDKWINKLSEKISLSSVDSIIKELSEKDNFKLASKIIEEETQKDDKKLSNFNSFRNYAMSAIPDSDKKIYTFMFRAQLFNQLHTIVVISLFLGLSVNILSFWTNIVDNYIMDWIVLVIFFILAFTLRIGWKRFYTIAMNIPFSIYLSNSKRINNET